MVAVPSLVVDVTMPVSGSTVATVASLLVYASWVNVASAGFTLALFTVSFFSPIVIVGFSNEMAVSGFWGASTVTRQVSER